ncbi:MAG: MOSC domain-containing protein [Solirubrobacteraceae bacterium]
MVEQPQSPGGLVESLNVGAPKRVRVNGDTVLTAIWKHPVSGRVPLRGVNVLGDDQADRSVHGGPDKAVYAYAREDIDWWEAELARPLGTAPFGENLTLRGLPVSEAVIGEQWAVGSARLQVAQPRLPCFKLGLRMSDPRFLKRFAAAGRPGAYLRIMREGDIAAGDEVTVLHRPAHAVTTALVSRALLGEHHLLPAALAAPELPGDLRARMRKRAA